MIACASRRISDQIGSTCRKASLGCVVSVTDIILLAAVAVAGGAAGTLSHDPSEFAT